MQAVIEQTQDAYACGHTIEYKSTMTDYYITRH